MPWACGILGSGPGMEPVSIAVEDRFLTTGAPGKSHFLMLYTSLLFLGILLFRLQGVPSPLWILFGPNFPGGSAVRNLPTSAGDSGSVPGLARSLGGGNGNPLQYSCLGNPMERGVWQLQSCEPCEHGFTKELDTVEQLNSNNNVWPSSFMYRPINYIPTEFFMWHS